MLRAEPQRVLPQRMRRRLHGAPGHRLLCESLCATGWHWRVHRQHPCISPLLSRRAGGSTTRAPAYLSAPWPSFTTSTPSGWSPTPTPSSSLAPSVWPSAPVSTHQGFLVATYSESAVFFTKFFTCFLLFSSLQQMCDWGQFVLPLFSQLFGGRHLVRQQLSCR